MNEEKLKKIWQTEQSALAIDLAGFQNSLSAWQDNLRRKIKIDIAAQILLLGVALVLVLFYPKLFFMFWFGVVLAAWYIWEIFRLYRAEKEPAHPETVKQFLAGKILKMKNLIWRTRIVAYFLPLVLVPAGYYALDYFDDASLTLQRKIFSVIFTIALTELVCGISMEIYFRIFYSGALKELKDLLWQLNSDE
jgi:hypothetical protein